MTEIFRKVIFSFLTLELLGTAQKIKGKSNSSESTQFLRFQYEVWALFQSPLSNTRCHNARKFGVVNKSTTVNRFVLHTLQRNITHSAVITRKTNIKLGILRRGETGKELRYALIVHRLR